MRLAASLLFSSAIAAIAFEWPQLLGPARNGVSPEPAKLSLQKPRLLWKKQVGAGFSSPVVAGGKLILFHRQADKEIVECMNARTGERIWAFEYATAYRDDFGFDEGPRGTPTVSNGRVYTHGAEGVLHALDLSTGRKLWRVDTYSKFGVRKGFFGAAASPLVGDAVYLNVGGLAAFDKSDGKVLWTATSDEAGYSSPISATIAGKLTILCFTRAGLLGVDPGNGKVRFQFPWRSRSHASVNAALPVVVGDLVFVSASYSTGAAVVDLGGSAPKVVWSLDDTLSNHYATSVHKDGFLFGYHGRQEMGQSLRCIEFRTGKVRWSVDDFGAGTVTLLGGKLLLIREGGEAVLAAASAEGFRPESRTQLLPGVVRSYPAIAGSVVYLRNTETLAAYGLN